jgi:tetratricopeptide (TPR) repeat protein
MNKLAGMNKLALFGFLALFPAFAVPASAQSEVGEVAFANSGPLEAQEPFLRGLALLHNFEYPDAAEQFRKAEAVDPDFAMASWGEAMTFTHPVWMQQDLEAARAALGRLGATPEARLAKAKTERERDYLRAVEVLYGSGTKEERDFRYSDAMAALHQRYPEDVDATAFYALSLLGTAHQGRDFAIYMKSAALLEEVFPTHPRHPGVLHYLNHSYDDPIHAPLGVRAARLYGSVAPNAGHALHMTSHIFVALGRWDDVIAANERAMSVVNRHRAGKHQPAKTCGHYVTWLHYAYLQERRLDDARQQLDGCRRMAVAQASPTPPEKDDSIVPGYAEMRLFHLIETGRWDAADAFAIPEGRYADAKFLLAYGDALAASGGELKSFHAAAARLRERQRELLAEAGTREETVDRAYAEIVTRQIDALERLRDGKTEEGIAMLRKTAEAESAMPLEFGPPPVQKPTFELLGDELLVLGRNAEAEQAYQSALTRAPGRTRSLQGRLRAEQALGKTGAAERTRAQLQEYVRPAPAARTGSL